MANIRITFVLPKNAQNESEVSHLTKQAYNTCKNSVKEISWATETDLQNRNLSKGDYLVFEDFGDNDYSSYIERQCVVISPLAISVCLIEGKSIPNFKWPILSISMYGCEVSCSQLPKSDKELVKKKVQLMGGIYSGDFTDSVTHLICGNSNSDKYRLAVEKGVLIMLPTWINHMYELSRKNNINCHDKNILDEFKCPPFQNLTICATGLTNAAQKTKLVEIVEANGGKFNGSLVLSQTDVLICYGTVGSKSEKYKSAVRYRTIYCVTPDWIYDSVEKGYAMPYKSEKYRVKTATSTPTKEGERMDPNFSTISAVQGQLSICQTTRINETINSSSLMTKNRSCKRKAEDLVEQLSMKKVMGAGHFLDGCSVFLVGFSATRRDKLNKIINISGATRYDEFSDRVTHVIVADPTCREFSQIKENCGGCHLVTLQWVLDSVDEQKPAQENNYIVTNLDGTTIGDSGNTLPKEVLNLFEDDRTTTLCDTVSVEQEHDDDDALTQKYLKAIDTIADVEDTLANMLENHQSALPQDFKITALSSFQPQNTSTQISEATSDLTSNSIQTGIFENLKFSVHGFAEEINKIHENCIRAAGGTISSTNCDYALVPIIYNSAEVSATSLVNDIWLHENLESQVLISDLQYYHQPIELRSTDIFNGCVMSISTYTNYEKEFLKSLITGLGGIFQEQFSKKSYETKNVLRCTHLIIPEASGKKYEAAVRWNFPVTTKDWLLACAKAGEKLPWENYLVDNETLTSNSEKVLTPLKIDNPPHNLKTPASNFQPTSQVTPINKILQDAIDSKVLPTPPIPKQYHPWDPKTPDTPLGAFITPNPPAWMRKELQKYVNSYPDFVPPKRRNSTPLPELLKRLQDKAAGRGEYSKSSEVNDEEQSLPKPQRLTFEDPKSNIDQLDNTSIHQKLQDLQQMVTSSANAANNTPRKSTWIEPSSVLYGSGKTQSQVNTVNWDYGEEHQQNFSEKVIMLSGLPDRDRLIELVKSLGGIYLDSGGYDPNATHLICLKPGRNEKTLSCIAAGKWILNVSYLEASATAGHFLNEEDFEFGNPKARKNKFYEDKDSCICYWRKTIAARGYGAFHDMRAIIIAEKKEMLAKVVEAGGGVVVNIEPPFNDSVHATHCLMEMKSIKDISQFVPLAKQGVKCVNTVYLNDFLWKRQQNDLDYIVPYFTKYY